MASYIGVSPPEQTGIVERYQFTGDGSTTVFSGNDNNGKEFRYISTNTLLVFLNGVQLVEDTDFTKTSNSQITFAVAPTAADELELLTFGSFDLNSPSTLRTDLGLELANGKILLGNSSGVSTQVTPSGDATLSNEGVITLADTYRIPGKLAGTNFTDSILIGHSTTGTLNDAFGNTGVGINTLDALTSGDQNTAIGNGTGGQITSGTMNTLMGVYTGQSFTTLGYSVGIGGYALQDTNANFNTAVGYAADMNNVSGTNNVALGQGSMSGVHGSSHSYDTALGSKALYALTTGNYNIGIGYQSGDNITSGSGNVVIGVADVASATGDKQFKISDGVDGSVVWLSGDSSGNLTTVGDITLANNKKVIFGDAGENISGDGTQLTIASSQNLVIDAGNDMKLDAANGNFYFYDDGVLFGHILRNSYNDFKIRSYIVDKDFRIEGNDGGSIIEALILDMSEAGNATFNGTVSMSGGQAIPGKVQGTNFTDSLLVGHSTTGTLSSADRNTGVGIEALDALTAGDTNTAVGYQSGTLITYGQQNTSLGGVSLAANVSGGYNTSAGAYSLQKTTASNNTAFGYQAGKELLAGASNIFLGFQSGNNITTGSGNVVIGNGDVASATGDKQLKISDGVDGSVVWLTGDSSGNLTTIGDVTLANDKKVIFGDAGEFIRGDGTRLFISSSAELRLDSASASGFVDFRQSGTQIGMIGGQGGTDFLIQSAVQDKDLKFRGSDGGSAITALTLDMSDAGTAIFNHDILPTTDATQDLGSTSKRWNNIYTGDLHLSNESTKSGNSIDGTTGNWTLQEGQSDLFLINNNTGKKYKFKIEEIE